MSRLETSFAMKMEWKHEFAFLFKTHETTRRLVFRESYQKKEKDDVEYGNNPPFCFCVLSDSSPEEGQKQLSMQATKYKSFDKGTQSGES